MKDKVFSASDYTKFLRQSANTTLSVADGPGKGSERVSEVSKSPITDRLSIANNIQFTRSFLLYQKQLVLTSPSDISGLVRWLDGADRSSMYQDIARTLLVIAGGQKVAVWIDKAGGTTYTQPTLASAPTYGSDLQFNGSQSLTSTLGNTFPLGPGNGTYFFVVRPTTINAAAQNVFFSMDNFNFGINHSTTSAYYLGTNGGGGGTTDSVNVQNKYSICCLQLTGTDSRSSNAWRNSTLFNGQYNQPYSLSLTDGKTASIGTKNPSIYGVPFTGGVAEILIYNAILSTADRQQVEGYLAWKWGFQVDLPSNHPFKNAAPYTFK